MEHTEIMAVVGGIIIGLGGTVGTILPFILNIYDKAKRAKTATQKFHEKWLVDRDNEVIRDARELLGYYDAFFEAIADVLDRLRLKNGAVFFRKIL